MAMERPICGSTFGRDNIGKGEDVGVEEDVEKYMKEEVETF